MVRAGCGLNDPFKWPASCSDSSFTSILCDSRGEFMGSLRSGGPQARGFRRRSGTETKQPIGTHGAQNLPIWSVEAGVGSLSRSSAHYSQYCKGNAYFWAVGLLVLEIGAG